MAYFSRDEDVNAILLVMLLGSGFNMSLSYWPFDSLSPHLSIASLSTRNFMKHLQLSGQLLSQLNDVKNDVLRPHPVRSKASIETN